MASTPAMTAASTKLYQYISDIVVLLENKDTRANIILSAETGNDMKMLDAIESHINDLMIRSILNPDFDRRTKEDANFASFWRELKLFRGQWNELDYREKMEAMEQLRNLRDAAKGPDSQQEASNGSAISDELRNWIELLLRQLHYKDNTDDGLIHRSIHYDIDDIVLNIRTEASFDREMKKQLMFSVLWSRLETLLDQWGDLDSVHRQREIKAVEMLLEAV